MLFRFFSILLLLIVFVWLPSHFFWTGSINMSHKSTMVFDAYWHKRQAKSFPLKPPTSYLQHLPVESFVSTCTKGEMNIRVFLSLQLQESIISDLRSLYLPSRGMSRPRGSSPSLHSHLFHAKRKRELFPIHDKLRLGRRSA